MALTDLNPLNVGIKQFYNRFSTNSIGVLDKNAAYTLAQPYNFNVSMFFTPFSLNPLQSSRVAFYLGLNTTDGLGVISASQSFRFLVQSIDLPKIASVDKTEGFNTEFGYGSFAGKYILPESNLFSLNMLSTELSVHEHAFYYWLHETAAQTWQYDTQPFSKATLIIQNLSSSNKMPTSIYILSGCYPVSIEPVKLNHNQSGGDQSYTRKIEFNFNKLMIVPNVLGLVPAAANWATSPFSPEN